jgi:hypothetical protein
MCEIKRGHIRKCLLLKLVEAKLMNKEKYLNFIQIKEIEPTFNDGDNRSIIGRETFKNHINVMCNRYSITDRGEFVDGLTDSQQILLDRRVGERVSSEFNSEVACTRASLLVKVFE